MGRFLQSHSPKTLHPGALPPSTSYMLSCLHFVLPQKCGRLLLPFGCLPGHSCPTELDFTVDGCLHAPCTTDCYCCCGRADSAAGRSLPFWPSPASPGEGRGALQGGSAWRQLFLTKTTWDGVAGCPGLTPEAGASLVYTGQPQQELEKSPSRLMRRCFDLLKHPSPVVLTVGLKWWCPGAQYKTQNPTSTHVCCPREHCAHALACCPSPAPVLLTSIQEK